MKLCYRINYFTSEKLLSIKQIPVGKQTFPCGARVHLLVLENYLSAEVRPL